MAAPYVAPLLQNNHFQLRPKNQTHQQPTSAMDDVNYIRYRNIELETELRLVKEQLAQAQRGTQYLINCLSNQYPQPRNQTANVERTGTRRPQLANAENARLRHAPNFTQNIYGSITSKQGSASVAGAGCVESNQSASNHRSNELRSRDGDFTQPNEEDLLTLDDQHASPSAETVSPGTVNSSRADHGRSSLIDSPIDTPLTPFTPPYGRQDVFSPAPHGQLIGLGISNIDTTHLGCNDGYLVPTTEAGGYGVVPAPISHSVPNHDSDFDKDIGAWRACRSPPSVEPVLIFNRPFADHEHNRLMGSAVFVEDMSEEEQMDHWVEFARKNGRHSAEEWKLYYDRVIRAAYLAKISARGIDKAVEEEVVEDGLVEGGDDGALETGVVLPDQGLASSVWAPGPQENRFVEAGINNDPAPDQPDAAVQVTSCMRIEFPCKAAPEASTDKVESPDHLDRSILRANGNEQTAQEQESTVSSSPLHTDRRNPALRSALTEAHTVTTTPPKTTVSGLERDDKHAVEDSQSSASEYSAAIPPPPPYYFGPPRAVSDILFNITSTDSTLFRTVLISNIPITATLSEILSRVRGGKIVSANFLETAGMKTNPPTETNAAIIVFLGAQRAKAYVDFCKDNPIFFSCTNRTAQVKAKVELVRTPSRPLHPKLLADFQNGLTRVLFIIDDKSRWRIDEIVAEFANCGIGTPLNTGRDRDGILFFEFADARDAGAAWAVVDRHHWVFCDASKGFFPDPCARPFGTLKSESQVGEAKADESMREDEGGSEERVVGMVGSTAATRIDGGANGDDKTEEDVLEQRGRSRLQA